MIEIPNPGDRLRIFQHTHPNPNGVQIREFIENPWQPPSPGTRPLEVFPDWAMVCLRRHKRGEQVLSITSAEFPEPIRSQGIKIPLECCEILERDYGLPALTVAVEPVAPVVVPVVLEVEQLRIA